MLTPEEFTMKRAARMDGIAGFGIDRVAAAVLDADVLRLENLDTDLGLPPEAISVTRSALDDPVSNSWLPFTGDLGLRAAISEHIAARHGRVYDPEREIVVTCGGTEGVLDVLLATIDPGDEVVLTDPTYAGLVNRVRLAGGVPVCAPLAVVEGEWRLDRDALAASVSERTVALLLMSPSMPSGCVLSREDWAFVASLCVSRDLFLLYDAAMEALLFDGRAPVSPLDASRDGRADGDRRLDVQGLPDDRLARRLGRGAGGAGERRRLGAHLQHDRQRSVSRRAAEAVLRGPQEHVGAAVAEFERRRDAIIEALPGWPIVRRRAAGRC